MYRIKESISKAQIRKLYEIVTNKPVQIRVKVKQHYPLDILIGKLMWAIFFNNRGIKC